MRVQSWLPELVDAFRISEFKKKLASTAAIGVSLEKMRYMIIRRIKKVMIINAQ